MHTIVHAGGRLYELLSRSGQGANAQPLGYTVWFREHNRHYPDELAAEQAGLRAIERLVSGPAPDPAYHQAVLPLPVEHLWFLAC